MARLAVLATLLLSFLGAHAQGPSNKGSFFLYWGYNRAWYSWSDIHFDGPGYDFTLRHVRAYDRPSSPSLDLAQIWIPQYNYRLGWFFHDRWSVSLGLDHMKYVVAQEQQVRMDGMVDTDRMHKVHTAEGDHMVTITPDFLQYEHTDGLNLLSVDVDHYDLLWSAPSGKHHLQAFEGLHIGPVIPRTDVRLFGEGINNRFNVAGFATGAQAGLHFTFLRHFFVRGTLKAGWVDLPHVLTTGKDEDHAGQHFWFVQTAMALGGSFRF